MPTAQTGSTEISSAARAGCMQSGATTVAPSAAAAAEGDQLSADGGGQPVAAGETLGEDGAGHGGVRREPAHPDELGRPLVDGAVPVKAPVSRTMPKPYATPSWPAPASTLTPSAVSSSLPQVRKAMSGTLRHRCARSPPARRAAWRPALRRVYLSSTSRARYVVSPTLVSMCTAPGSR